MKNAETEGEFFLATNPESSGSPPRRAPPVVPFEVPSRITQDVPPNPFEEEEEDEPDVVLNSQSVSGQDRNLTVDDIDDFEDDDDLEELTTRRYSRRTINDTADLVVGLPSFATGNYIFVEMLSVGTRSKTFLCICFHDTEF